MPHGTKEATLERKGFMESQRLHETEKAVLESERSGQIEGSIWQQRLCGLSKSNGCSLFNDVSRN